MSIVLCGFTFIKHDILHRETMNNAMSVHHVTCPTTSLARVAMADPKTVCATTSEAAKEHEYVLLSTVLLHGIYKLL